MSQIVLQGLKSARLATQGFAISVSEPAWAPTVDDFKDFFDRDFTFGFGLETVRDKDIAKAIAQVFPCFNQALWDPTELDPPFLYAAAHFLVTNIQAAGGLSSKNRGLGIKSRGSGTVASKSVGPVSVNYAIDDTLKNDPILSQFMKTNYGQQYLTILTPRLVAPGYVVSGRSFNPYGNTPSGFF